MDEQLQRLQKQVDELKTLVQFLLKENADLKRRLAKYAPKKKQQQQFNSAIKR